MSSRQDSGLVCECGHRRAHHIHGRSARTRGCIVREPSVCACMRFQEVSPHRDLDVLDLEHDLGLRDLTDPFTGE